MNDNQNNPAVTNIDEQKVTEVTPAPVVSESLNAPKQENSNKQLKTASQMIWLFIGSYLVCSFVAYLVNGMVNNLSLPAMITLIVKIIVAIGFYYFTVKNMFKKSVLYKGELSKLKKKVIVVLIIFGLITLALEYLPGLIYGSFSFAIEMGLGKELITALVSSIIGALIIPLVAFTILLNKLGVESESIKPE